MEVYADKPVNLQALNVAIQALGLPNFIGTARLSRDWADGSPVAPYILVKVGPLDAGQKTQLDAVIDAHDGQPLAKAPSRVEALIDKVKGRAATLEELQELIESRLLNG